MPDKKSNGICHVGCEVANCAYHGDNNCCCADEITVESPSALRKGETFCSTFTTSSNGKSDKHSM
ncbi:MAG: DUF1540 domain-containing protein [Oscillospiraceae bacterium]